jgi:hypothetical protein
MARGWESKSVEAQQEEAASAADKPTNQYSPERVAARQQREGLALMRKKLEHDLDAASNPRHREMLERALQDLDRRMKDAAGSD